MSSVHNHTDIKIFLVDDDAFNLKVIKFHLNQLGYKDVTPFDNGVDCLKQLTLKPNIVFLDQYMYGVQGIDVLREIKQLDPEIIVVMLSAEDSKSSAELFRQQGAFDYIIKGNEAINRISEVLTKLSPKA